MADNQNFKCTGNCLNCLPAQRAYCASQHAYSNMKVLDAMMQEMLSLKSELTSLREDLHSNEANVFAPTKEEKSEIPNLPIAQEGDGAEE